MPNKGPGCLSTLPKIAQTEVEKNLDRILQQIDNGAGPFLVCSDTGKTLVLMGWDDYWEHFEILYPKGERERIENMCNNMADVGGGARH